MPKQLGYRSKNQIYKSLKIDLLCAMMLFALAFIISIDLVNNCV